MGWNQRERVEEEQEMSHLQTGGVHVQIDGFELKT